MIDEQEQNLMSEQFERREEEVIGYCVHVKLHTMIDAWAEV